MGNKIGVAESTLKAFEPLVLQQILHGEGSVFDKTSRGELPRQQNLGDAVASFLGFASYPGSPYDDRRKYIEGKAAEMFGRNYDSLTFGEQAKLIKTIERSPDAPKKPEPSPQAVERAMAMQVERTTRLTKMISEESQGRLTSLGKKLPHHDASISLAGVDVPLSKDKMAQYEGLIAEEYDRTIGLWPMERVEALNPESRDTYLRKTLTEAKERAKARLIRGDEAAPKEKKPKYSLLGIGR